MYSIRASSKIFFFYVGEKVPDPRRRVRSLHMGQNKLQLSLLQVRLELHLLT